MERLNAAALDVMQDLQEGNERFRSRRAQGHGYTPEELLELSREQHPKVAIIACSDSRVSPEIVFNQPLGVIFSSRVPGNVASDSAKWMLELAVGEFKVPLVLVLGHTGCLAVGQMLQGDRGGAGGMHRHVVLTAVYRAKERRRDEELYQASVEENVAQTVEHLVRDSYTLRAAMIDGSTSIAGGIYDMETGEVRILDIPVDLYGRY